ncbi:DinB family protein [Carboxydochorda subterranea]|uniref:DinB family protein n=1 Tax=Carboxydichorda subterranea TaxID=3109565 RepID=A0ABZ1BZ85_9FIRM|nr:DinB family protein [Limnochorda sp. L945t]WRP17398.1 DinB family protein [Limnochorda sp. L945t]
MARSASPATAMEAALRLRAAVASFASYITGLPESFLQPGEWGPREVLVHLVFWHETHAATIGALLRGEEPALPVGTFAQLNARAVRANADQPITRLIERLEAAQRELERLVVAAGGRDLPGIRTKAGAKPRDLRAALLRMEAHVRHHERKLARETAGGNGSRKPRSPVPRGRGE